MSEDGPGRPPIDSSRWTGRGRTATRADKRAAWQAFHVAAGPKATAPRRAAALVCGIGGVLVPSAVAALSPERLPRLCRKRLHLFELAHGQ